MKRALIIFLCLSFCGGNETISVQTSEIENLCSAWESEIINSETIAEVGDVWGTRNVAGSYWNYIDENGKNVECGLDFYQFISGRINSSNTMTVVLDAYQNKDFNSTRASEYNPTCEEAISQADRMIDKLEENRSKFYNYFDNDKMSDLDMNYSYKMAWYGVTKQTMELYGSLDGGLMNNSFSNRACFKNTAFQRSTVLYGVANYEEYTTRIFNLWMLQDENLYWFSIPKD